MTGHQELPAEGRGEALAPQASALPARFANLVELTSVDSTNRYAADAVRAGADDGLVVVAQQQTAGRGRQGRSWLAPAGGALLCSLVVRPRLPLASLQLVGAALGLAALDAIRETSGVTANLKWPNDVLIGELKVAGILAELVESATARPAVVVGIGLNCAFPPGWADTAVTDDGSALRTLATTLAAEAGAAPPIDELLVALLVAFERWLTLLEAADGPASFVAAYRLACSTLGQLVEVTTPQQRISGRATGIAPDGRLEITSAAGAVLLDAGDVVHLRRGA